jgi:phosphoribosylformylglycinamidine synthase subunit PurQ / glutaminase
MPQPRVLILRAPGANCDAEAAYAFERAGALPRRVHVNQVLEAPEQLAEYQILCIPGGFSYGDDIAAGRILANQLRHHLAEPIEAFKAAGNLILGICNGFQILLKAGILLPPERDGTAQATLSWNQSGKFEDRWVPLATSGSKSIFFAGIETMYLPVAHAEGRFVPRNERVLRELEAAGQVVLRYGGSRQAGGMSPQAPYPENPNGSTADIAGVCDASGRVCGLMPHPERHIDPMQHPRWTRGSRTAVGDGLRVFQNAVEFFR